MPTTRRQAAKRRSNLNTSLFQLPREIRDRIWSFVIPCFQPVAEFSMDPRTPGFRCDIWFTKFPALRVCSGMRTEMTEVIRRQWRVYVYAQRRSNVFVPANDFLRRLLPACRQNLRHIHLGRTVPGFAGYCRQLSQVRDPNGYYADQNEFFGLVEDMELRHLGILFDMRTIEQEPLVLDAPWLKPFLALLEIRRKGIAGHLFTLDIVFINRSLERPGKEMVVLIKKLQCIKGINCEWRGKEIETVPQQGKLSID